MQLQSTAIQLEVPPFESIEKLIYGMARSFNRAYGADFDDLLSEAQQVYLAARESYNGESKFSTWLQCKLQYAFMDYVRNRKTHTSVHYLELSMKEEPTFNLEEFASKLSEDAKLVLKLSLDSPPELVDLMNRLRSDLPTKTILMRFLSVHFRWFKTRAFAAFNEISEAL